MLRVQLLISRGSQLSVKYVMHDALNSARIRIIKKKKKNTASIVFIYKKHRNQRTTRWTCFTDSFTECGHSLSKLLLHLRMVAFLNNKTFYGGSNEGKLEASADHCVVGKYRGTGKNRTVLPVEMHTGSHTGDTICIRLYRYEQYCRVSYLI